MKLKPLEDQTLVLTGATSGIGLVTARMAAKKGARLILVARDEDSLRQVCEEINRDGGHATFVVADVGDEAQVRQVARQAIEQGGFDTWINNAGMAIYGRMLDIPTEDHRKLFDTNFWGYVYGSLEAARHLQTKTGAYAGAIVNVGSVVSDRVVPVQSMYSTSKHAVKGFTDALRMELEKDKAPISVSLVKPAAIATPFPQHARNYMEEEPSLPPPVYAPELVAQAILHCCEQPQRDIFVGGGGKMLSALGTYAPTLTDTWMVGKIFEQQKKPEPARDRPDSLYEPGFGMQERGDLPERTVLEASPYTWLGMHPIMKGALFLGAGLVAFSLLGKKRK